MITLVTYDVCTETAKGRARLRKVAKICEKYGQRVQNSVFECLSDAPGKRMLEHELMQIIDINEDSLRLYNLGNSSKAEVVCYGVSKVLITDDVLII